MNNGVKAKTVFGTVKKKRKKNESGERIERKTEQISQDAINQFNPTESLAATTSETSHCLYQVFSLSLSLSLSLPLIQYYSLLFNNSK